MSHNVPPDDGLSAKKQIAVERLAIGGTVISAAQLSGVTPKTIHRWRRDDPEFRNALSAARRDLRERAEILLLNLAGHAFATVAQAVQSGDVRASLAVLRGVGALNGSAPAFVITDDRPAQTTQAPVADEAGQEQFDWAHGCSPEAGPDRVS